MEKPTLEEVKEYFKNAKTVESKLSGLEDNITGEFSIFCGDWYILGSKREVEVWNKSRGYAKILTTKKPTYSITADQLMQLENGFTLPKLQKWFPEVFVKKLEVGKWMKTPNGGFYCPKEKLKNGFGCYGISSGKTWLEGKVSEKEAINDVEATEQEVFEVLGNEAVKRGFVEGEFVDGFCGKCFIESNECELDNRGFWMGGSRVFSNGEWGELVLKIPTKTRKQAEQELNCKIID